MSDKKGYRQNFAQDVAFEFKGDMRMNPRCICDNSGCARQGNCKACMEFHRLTDHPPTCRYKWHWIKGKNAQFL